MLMKSTEWNGSEKVTLQNAKLTMSSKPFLSYIFKLVEYNNTTIQQFTDIKNCEEILLNSISKQQVSFSMSLTHSRSSRGFRML
jgi:hypothetical protein